MKQVLAAIVAVALVGGAWWVRTEVIAPAEDSPVVVDGGQGGDSPAAQGPVLCDEVLGEACPAGATVLDSVGIVDALADRASDAAVVLAPSLVVEMVEQSGRSAVTLDSDRVVVATTPLVVAVAAGRADDVCPTWTCVQQRVATGGLRPGLADPSSDTVGVAALAALAGGWFSDTGGQFNLNGFSTGEFIAWLAAVRGEAIVSSSPVQDIIRFTGSRNDSAVVTEADAIQVLQRAASAPPVLTHPEPLAVLTVVAVGIDGNSDLAGDVAVAARQPLLDAGWRGPDGATPDSEHTPDAPALPADPVADDGLPSGGVTIALQQRWS